MTYSKGLDGGIGRRARLKIWLSQGSAGSIPVRGTLIIKQLRISVAAFLFQSKTSCTIFCTIVSGKPQ